MSVSRIAKRYAKPILDLSVEKKQLEEVRADMVQFLGLCKSNRDLVNLLKSPIIPNLKKAAILQQLFSGKLNEITLSAFNIITKKGREAYLLDIAEEFLSMYNDKMGYQEASVTTTIALDSSLRKAFEAVVKDISGKKPVLTEKVNEALIGGFTLKLGDRQVDESVSGKLKELKLKFLQDN